MFDLHDVRDMIFYDKGGNKLFKLDKVEKFEYRYECKCWGTNGI